MQQLVFPDWLLYLFSIVLNLVTGGFRREAGSNPRLVTIYLQETHETTIHGHIHTERQIALKLKRQI